MKSGSPVTSQQVRLGVGQVLEYCHLIGDAARSVLLVESAPPEPWPAMLPGHLGIGVLRADRLSASLDALLSG